MAKFTNFKPFVLPTKPKELEHLKNDVFDEWVRSAEMRAFVLAYNELLRSLPTSHPSESLNIVAFTTTMMKLHLGEQVGRMAAADAERQLREEGYPIDDPQHRVARSNTTLVAIASVYKYLRELFDGSIRIELQRLHAEETKRLKAGGLQ